jgi:hypothetical protein
MDSSINFKIEAHKKEQLEELAGGGLSNLMRRIIDEYLAGFENKENVVLTNSGRRVKVTVEEM